jgi:[acyl-carrier-protein] S-malonyltransferase
MTAVAFLFPGQGSQRPGMAAELVRRRPEYFERADEILGFGLTALCLDGTAEELRPTEIAQPAIFLTSVVHLDLLRAHGAAPAAVAGHSVGEYAALVAAGALAWQDGLRLVRRRGELMAEGTAGTGMLAVSGPSAEQVAEFCAGASVWAACYNEPAQTIVAGRATGLRQVAERATAAGAKVDRLRVSAAFHSPLMAEAAGRLAAVLDRTPLADPELPLIANATADRVHTAAEVRACLRAQMTAPVRWTETVQRLAADGIEHYTEVGPGRVLAGLTRRIVPGATVDSTDRRIRRPTGV